MHFNLSQAPSLSHSLLRSLSSLSEVPGLDLGLSTADLLGKELNTLISTAAVGEVRSKEGEAAAADEIANVADDLDLIAGEVGDLAVILVTC